MAIQRNVKQQNALSKEEMQRCANLVEEGSLPWLPAALSHRGHKPGEGILVRLAHVPEQEGNLYYGTWLDPDLTFWQFTAMVPYASPTATATIESFEEVTSHVTVEKHGPGTGKSFGELAIEVLRERRDA